MSRARLLLLLLASAVALLLACGPVTVAAYYVPGVSPTFYEPDATVEFTVNSLRSNSVMFPLDYYRKTPFCQPAKIEGKKDTIGETIWGDRKYNSLYRVKMGVNSSCMVLQGCNAAENTKAIIEKLKFLNKTIERGYRGFMNIDNLPVFNSGVPPLGGACNEKLPVSQRNHHQRGYALGVPRVCGKGTLLNNHLRFRIYFNSKSKMMPAIADKEKDTYAVVGLEAVPYSVRHEEGATDCRDEFNPEHAQPLALDDLNSAKGATPTVYWSYSVEWVPSDVMWATRWDAYFRSSAAGSNTMAHFFYMGAGLLIVALVAGAVASILMRTLRRDIVRYNSLTVEELQEETGWKLVHADVFRPPNHAGLLCILFGNGAQILSLVGGLLLLSIMGLLSPSRRGSLLLAVIALSIFTSLVNGYACGFLQRYLNCKSWRDVFISGCALQGTVCGVYLLTVIIGKAHGSTTAVPFSVIFLLFSAWVTVSLPLTILGASFAYHQAPLSNPVQVGRLAREIPTQPVMNEPLFLYLIPPLFPMATILMELHLVMRALWAGEVYYVFGFMGFAGVLWAAVAALVTVSQLYYVLCYENHRWWWIAFACPGCMGFHMFIYAAAFFFTQLSMQSFTSSLLYFLYMGIISYGYGLASGTIGLAAGITFTRFIYGSIKVD